MAEYIEREAVLKKMQNWHTKERLINCVEDIPAANVVEVKHGEWILDPTYTGKYKKIWVCSNCLHWQSVKVSGGNKDNPNKMLYMNYCPFCGAKMKNGGVGNV